MYQALTSLITVVLLLLSSSCHAGPSSSYDWTQLEKGLAYAKISFSTGPEKSQRRTTLHAFKIDPKRFKLDVITAPPDKKLGEYVGAMAKRSGAMIAVNGGFFTPERKSIGLLVKSSKQINPLHQTSWWSIFALHNDKPLILRPWQAKGWHNFQMAIQAGPRLVVNNDVPKLKSDTSNARTAIGITAHDEVIIVVTAGAGVTMKTLAERMRAKPHAGGLGCPDAMALDGGSSTQLYADAGNIKLDLSGFSRVPNALGVFRK